MSLNNKLKSTSGESIAEVLIAMLVVALGSVLFASMVMASRDIVQKSEEAYHEYIEAHNDLETRAQATPSPDILEIRKSGNLISGTAEYTEKVNVYSAKNRQDYFTYEEASENVQGN